MGPKEYSCEQVKEGLGKNGIYLIDVRNHNERLNPGRIPGSLHVPLSEIGQAFTALSDEEFSAQYDFKRPSKNGREKVVVTTSNTGMQATSAANHLVQIGYENVAVFKGSFMEWKAMGNKIITGHMDKDRLVDFNQVKEAVEHNSLLVIDVRNPGERTNPGYISGTENVPLCEIWEAFSQLSDGEFEAKYGFAKPSLEQDMVLHCLKGKRALDASDKLSLLGYTKVKVYKGSFSEWKEKGGEVLTQ